MLSNYDRWCSWMLLEHGDMIEDKLEALYDRYRANSDKFCSDKLYFGCGHDAGKKKYNGWDMCDLREVPGVILWDVLLGLPYPDGVLSVVKTKLSLGMFTWHQARFLFWEIARALGDGGTLEVTYRDYQELIDRYDELQPQLYCRYIYGSGLYYGSRRRSCWTPDTVKLIANEFGLEEQGVASHRQMNATQIFAMSGVRKKKYTPEPRIKRDEDGNIVNDGGEFDMIKK